MDSRVEISILYLHLDEQLGVRLVSKTGAPLIEEPPINGPRLSKDRLLTAVSLLPGYSKPTEGLLHRFRQGLHGRGSISVTTTTG